MDPKNPRKFSINEIHAAGLTIDQIRKQKLLVDKRRKGLREKYITYLKSLNLPAQFKGKVPEAKISKQKAPRKKVKKKPQPKANPISKTAPKPKPAAKPAQKPVSKPTTKPTLKPKSKKSAKPEPKPAAPAKMEKKKEIKETSAPKTEKSTVTGIDPKVQEVVVKIFEETPLFPKKDILLETFEKKLSGLTDMKPEKILNTLKDANLIKYSRTAPRGYSMS